jgi:hypothetical protein
MAKQFVVTTDAKNTMGPATDHLQRSFRAAEPNQARLAVPVIKYLN